MQRAAALLLGLAAAFPTTATAQHRTRWFVDTGFGASWPAAYAFDRGNSARVGLGVEVRPSVAVRLSVDAERLPYSDERFANLFVITEPATADVGSLAAQVISLSANVEWSPVEWGPVAPLVGLSLSLQKRDATELIGSPAWGRCSTAARFVYSTDPETGRTTMSAHNHTPEPGCADLRQDISIDGTSLGLTSSVGVNWRMERHAVMGALRFSPNLLPGSPVLSTDVAWRYYF